MKPINIIILLIAIITVLTFLIIILFKYFNEKILILMRKLDQSELEYKDKVKNKYNILDRMINLIENKYKTHSKVFDDIKKIKMDEITSLKNENLLDKCYKEIIEIKEDNKKVREVKSFKEVIEEYNENELHLISLRTFYNKYTLEYNNIIKKIPYNIVSLIKRYKPKSLLDGKEIESEYTNDLEV